MAISLHAKKKPEKLNTAFQSAICFITNVYYIPIFTEINGIMVIIGDRKKISTGKNRVRL